jgi:hypothetical protein
VFDSRATALEFLDRINCDPALAAASYRFKNREEMPIQHPN